MRVRQRWRQLKRGWLRQQEASRYSDAGLHATISLLKLEMEQFCLCCSFGGGAKKDGIRSKPMIDQAVTACVPIHFFIRAPTLGSDEPERAVVLKDRLGSAHRRVVGLTSTVRYSDSFVHQSLSSHQQRFDALQEHHCQGIALL